METGLLAGAYLAAAAVLVYRAVRLFRRNPAPALKYYAIYLVLWIVQNFFAVAFLMYSGYLPKAGRLGFILFNGIILIPIQAATTVAFVFFLWTMLDKRKHRGAIGAVLSAPFVVILVLYARQAFRRLAETPDPAAYQVSAPSSGIVMLGILIASACAVILFPILGKGFRRKAGLATVAGSSAAGLIVLIPVMRMSSPNSLGFFFSGFLWLAANVPAFIALSVMTRKERRDAAGAADDGRGIAEIAGRYGLSDRETQVLALVLRGRLNKEIAAELFVSTETVKKHLYNIFRKTSVRSRLQLLLLVRELESSPSRASSPAE